MAAVALFTVGTLLLLIALVESLVVLVSGFSVEPRGTRLAPIGAALLAPALGRLAREVPPGARRLVPAAAAAAVLVLVVSLGAELLGLGRSGVGRLQLMLGGGAVVALGVTPWIPGWLARLSAWRPPVSWADVMERWLPIARIGRVEGVFLGVLAALFAWVLVEMVGAKAPLGHDESAYALAARSWLEGTPRTGFDPHRGPALPALAVVVMTLTRSELALRGLDLLFALGGLVAVWALGRAIFSPAAGLVAAGALASAHTVQRRSAEFLTDVPAAVLLTVVALLLWQELEGRRRPGWRLLLAAVLAAGAFYLRYGSALPITLLAVTVLLIWGRRLSTWWHWGLAGGLVLVALLIPHLVAATRMFGQPWGILAYTGRVAGRQYLGQGLVDYVRWFPLQLAGPVAAAVMTAGLGWGAWLWTRSGEGQARRALAFLLFPAIAQVVLLGIVAHAEPRFVFFAIMLAVTAGGGAIARFLGGLELRTGVTLLLLGGMLYLAAFAAGSEGVVAGQRARAEGLQVLVDAARVIQDHSDSSCTVLTSYTPQITWYTGCSSRTFSSTPPETVGRLTDGDAYLLLFERGKRQPEGAELRSYLERAEADPLAELPDEGTLGRGVIYRLRG
jgi:hypothetical protein